MQMQSPWSQIQERDFERRVDAAIELERHGRRRMAWDVWEQLRADHPDRADWNGPLVASYLGYAMGWTADSADRRHGDVQDALGALVRALAILAGDLAKNGDDVTRWVLVARALEQRCILTAFADAWTAEAREALDAGRLDALPPIVGDRRLVRSTASAAEAALDVLATQETFGERTRAKLDASRRRVHAVLALLESAKRRTPQLALVGGGALERSEPRRPALAIA